MSAEINELIHIRFTAYLVTAINNKRIRYIKNQYKIICRETALDEELGTNFEEQFADYTKGQTDFIFEDWERIDDFLQMMENSKLSKAIKGLKERERRIIFARLFGQMSYKELGMLFLLKPKQAEMAYYYALRKLRKYWRDKDDI